MEMEMEKTDRITELPKCIRNHIVSFLPMEDALRTHVLSKEWNGVCASLSNLEFIQQRRDGTYFRDFVNQTLLLHDGSDVPEFTIFADDSHGHHIHEWISFAVNHNVKELAVYFTQTILESVPFCLFTCRTLRELELSKVHIQLPNNIDLPMLKSLILWNVTFCDDSPLAQLIPCCPVLEELELTHHSFDNKICIEISSSILRFLTLRLRYPFCELVKISAVNLSQMIYSGIPPDISSETLSSLCSASFDISDEPFSSDDPVLDVLCGRATNIFRGLHHVRELSLSGLFFEYLSSAQDLFSRPLTSPVRLKHLRLLMGTENYFHAILFLLKSYPNLETLSISCKGESASENTFNMEQYLQSEGLGAGCILKHLKSVTFEIFEETDDDLHLARYLLEHSDVLEEMKIINSMEAQANHENICQKLSMFTKVSASAVISFYYDPWI